MSIPENRFKQCFDYLSQIVALSGKDGAPNFTKSVIADKLSIPKQTLYRFLNEQTKKPKDLVENFIAKYPTEFAKWPKTADKIGRTLQKNDLLGFLAEEEKPKVTNQKQKTPPATPVKKKTTPATTVKKSLPKTFAAPANERTPIVISYRGHADIKDAHGMLFDHMRVQDITGVPTKVLIPRKRPKTAKKIKKLFKQVLVEHVAPLPFGKEKGKKRIPPTIKKFSEEGLLIIPGRVRAVENEPLRLRHEYRVIREALNRGQPILGICAGSWRLWEQCVSWIEEPAETTPKALQAWHQANETLVDVKDHNYNGGMLRLGKDGIHAVFNVQVHDIKVSNSTLKEILEEKRMTVNSVHWKAVNPAATPDNFVISATASKNKDIAMKSRSGEPMNPQKNSAEAFESKRGSPIMGVQWHPEGYDSETPSGEIFDYMAKAGDAYAAKRKMLKQFQAMHT